jgi:capsid protein
VCSAFDAFRADYDMAKESRFRRRLTGFSPMGSGADYHYRSEADFLKMMELARAMDRNDVIIGQGVTRLVDNVIQGGMRIDPDTGDDGADAVLKAKWREWSENPDLCDAAGEMTFCEIAEKALRATVVDGDQLFIPLEAGQLQVMEAHRCRTPNGSNTGLPTKTCRRCRW